MCGGAIYGYHGYQVYFFCVGVFGMGTTGTKYGLAIYGYHGYQVYFFYVGVFIMGTTGTKHILYWGVGERFMGTTGNKYTSSVWVFL